jgi:fermentation-respiration switch protein FrsA (DUF1100 family)
MPRTLLVHGDADSQAPVQMNRDFAALAAAKGWPMRYEEFPGAEHTEVWNSDPVRYEQLVTEFFSAP